MPDGVELPPKSGMKEGINVGDTAPFWVGTRVGDNVGVERPISGVLPGGVTLGKPAKSTGVCMAGEDGVGGFRQR